MPLQNKMRGIEKKVPPRSGYYRRHGNLCRARLLGDSKISFSPCQHFPSSNRTAAFLSQGCRLLIRDSKSEQNAGSAAPIAPSDLYGKPGNTGEWSRTVSRASGVTSRLKRFRKTPKKVFGDLLAEIRGGSRSRKGNEYSDASPRLVPGFWNISPEGRKGRSYV